jgi:hypothetical protein
MFEMSEERLAQEAEGAGDWLKADEQKSGNAASRWL